MARPTKLTPQVQSEIIKQLTIGLPESLAARLAGVGESTFHDWMQRGSGRHKSRYKRAIYVEFAEQVHLATAKAMQRPLLKINLDMMDNVQSAQWMATFLERRQVRQELKSEGQPGFPVTPAKPSTFKISPEDQAEVIAALIEAGAIDGDDVHAPDEEGNHSSHPVPHPSLPTP